MTTKFYPEFDPGLRKDNNKRNDWNNGIKYGLWFRQ